HLEAVGEAHFRDLAQRRVRLLRRGRVDAGADAAFLRALLESRNLLARPLRHPRLAGELIDRRHARLHPPSGRLPGPPGRKAPASRSDARPTSAQTAIAPFARAPGHGVLHRQRTASLLERDAIAVVHVNLTVEVSEAASELLASRLVPKPAGVENLAVSM